MRFTKTLLLALSAIAVRSAVIAQDNVQNAQNAQSAQSTQAAPEAQTENNTQSNPKQLTPEAQCVITNNCNSDVACIARCYNVPAPTNDMVYQTNDCAVKCPDPAVDNAGYLKCYNDCVDNFYMGNNAGAAAPATNANANANANANGQNNANNANGQNNANNANGQNNANNANGQNNANNANGNNANNANGNTNGNTGNKLNNTGNTIQESSATSMSVSALAIASAP